MKDESTVKKVRGGDFSPSELQHILTHAAAFQGLVTESERKLLERFASELIETNKTLNLTTITKAEDMAYLHFFDSLTLLPLLEELNYRTASQITLTDVGSGAGFPGIPLKIMRPQWKIVLLDALAKRVRFLNRMSSTLELTGLEAIHIRAEDAGHAAGMREQSDIVTARAVASLNVLAEYCLPLVKVGGYFIAMKADLDEELQEAQDIIGKLGGEVVRVERFVLPKVESKRSLLLIKKQRTSPAKYPRPSAQIKQNK